MRKPRADAILLNLPEEQQAQLAEWLLNGMPYHAAKAALEKQFGVQVKYLSAFSEFWSKVCQPALMVRRAKAVEIADQISKAAEQNAALDAGMIAALKQKAFELCQAPNANPQDVFFVISQALKIRDQDLKQSDLALKRDKFQFDAAKACLKQLPALKAIAGDNSLDQNGKINAIRQKLFGTLPSASEVAQ
jgi:hypothetical protein